MSVTKILASVFLSGLIALPAYSQNYIKADSVKRIFDQKFDPADPYFHYFQYYEKTRTYSTDDLFDRQVCGIIKDSKDCGYAMAPVGNNNFEAIGSYSNYVQVYDNRYGGRFTRSLLLDVEGSDPSGSYSILITQPFTITRSRVPDPNRPDPHVAIDIKCSSREDDQWTDRSFSYSQTNEAVSAQITLEAKMPAGYCPSHRYTISFSSENIHSIGVGALEVTVVAEKPLISKKVESPIYEAFRFCENSAHGVLSACSNITYYDYIRVDANETSTRAKFEGDLLAIDIDTTIIYDLQCSSSLPVNFKFVDYSEDTEYVLSHGRGQSITASWVSGFWLEVQIPPSTVLSENCSFGIMSNTTVPRASDLKMVGQRLKLRYESAVSNISEFEKRSELPPSFSVLQETKANIDASMHTLRLEKEDLVRALGTTSNTEEKVNLQISLDGKNSLLADLGKASNDITDVIKLGELCPEQETATTGVHCLKAFDNLIAKQREIKDHTLGQINIFNTFITNEISRLQSIQSIKAGELKQFLLPLPN